MTRSMETWRLLTCLGTGAGPNSLLLLFDSKNCCGIELSKLLLLQRITLSLRYTVILRYTIILRSPFFFAAPFPFMSSTILRSRWSWPRVSSNFFTTQWDHHEWRHNDLHRSHEYLSFRPYRLQVAKSNPPKELSYEYIPNFLDSLSCMIPPTQCHRSSIFERINTHISRAVLPHAFTFVDTWERFESRIAWSFTGLHFGM